MRCVIYTYGNHDRGMGHVYQSYALATALADHHDCKVTFLVPDYPAGIGKLSEWDLDVVPIPHALSGQQKLDRVAKHLTQLEPDVAVMDILESPPRLMAMLRSYVSLLVSIDDIGAGRAYADVLFNVIHHPPLPQGPSYTEFRDLGFVILRDSFRLLASRHKPVPKRAGRILITQGGSDTYAGTVHLVRELTRIPDDVEIVLLIGPAFQHHRELIEVIHSAPRRFTLLEDVADMAALMETCDLAITGAGKTVFELAAVGVPFVIVTEPDSDSGQVVVANFTSWREDKDQTCIIEPGETTFLPDRSVVACEWARPALPEDLDKLLERGLIFSQ